MGTAVDANVHIFERIRVELRRGRPAGRAIETSFGKALSAIMDSNITGLLCVIPGTWSTLCVAENIVLFLGIDRSDKSKRRPGHQFASLDA